MSHESLTRYIKQADVTSDFLGGGAANIALGSMLNKDPDSSASRFARSLHNAARVGGDVHGLLSAAPTIREIKEMDQNTGAGFVPGVSDSRLLRRRRAIRALLNSKNSNRPFSELIGLRGNILLSGLLGAGTGAGIGYYATHKKKPELSALGTGLGAAIGGVGGLIGGGLAQQIGMLAAGTTPRRTLEEQYDYENRNNWLRHLLVPGLANYDYYKSLGASKHISEMPEEDIMNEIARIRQAKGEKS